MNMSLEDPNQAVFYLPFAEGEDEEEVHSEGRLPRSLYNDRDILDGVKLRFDAYKDAWRKCLERVKSITHILHAPIAAKIVDEVHSSYDQVLPGLPYPELPVIGITNPTSSYTFIDQVTAHTDAFDLDSNDLFEATAFTAHLYPNDCVSLTSAMRTIISSFVERTRVLEKVKGRSGASLANYDIEVLAAWFGAVCDAYDLKEDCRPKLVVILHEFEQLDPIVIKDVFNISSLYVSRLPLVFILALSSPASPSYLHTAYPRSTLALLRFRNYTVPSGKRVLEEIILQTFFDPEFEPDIMIGPSLLAYLTDYYTRHDSSLDATLNILHLAHMKHFSVEPFTLLIRSTPPLDSLSQQHSFPFVDALFTRVQRSSEENPRADQTKWSQQTLESLITLVNKTRSLFYARATRLRIGFRIVKHIQDFMVNHGYKGLGWGAQFGGADLVEVMVDVLRGELGRDTKFLGAMVKKLQVAQLADLLKGLHTLFASMSLENRTREESAQTRLIVSINALPQQSEEDVSEIGSQLASSLGDWLVEYLTELLAPLEDSALWEVWYTGQTSFPVDILNPSLRASVVAGLLHPHDFSEKEEEEASEPTNPLLWELPDTSILFRRYLDSGKMINIYDWFEAFQQEIETQRKNVKKRAMAVRSRSRSPTKRGRNGKAKVVDVEAEAEGDPEKWRAEVQARFTTALQELDYLGFIKHTGRKADHVQRVVYDMHD